MPLRSVLTVFLSCVVACLLGCGGDKLDLVPVKGTVFDFTEVLAQQFEHWFAAARDRMRAA